MSEESADLRRDAAPSDADSLFETAAGAHEPGDPLRPAAAPPEPAQSGRGIPIYGRRPPPQQGPRPDEDGFYPDDYYVPTDWVRVVIGGIVSLTMLGGVVALGFYLFDRFDTGDSGASSGEIVSVYRCAGDGTAVGERTIPEADRVVGRSLGSDWLAFDNGDSTPRQLWIRAGDLTAVDAEAFGVVPSATSPTELPTPLAGTVPAN